MSQELKAKYDLQTILRPMIDNLKSLPKGEKTKFITAGMAAQYNAALHFAVENIPAVKAVRPPEIEVDEGTLMVPVSPPDSGRDQVTTPALTPLPGLTEPGRMPASGDPPLNRPAMAVAIEPRCATVKPDSQLPLSIAARSSPWVENLLVVS